MLHTKAKVVNGELIFTNSAGDTLLEFTSGSVDVASRYNVQLYFASAEVSGSKFAVAPSAGTIIGAAAAVQSTASATVLKLKYGGSALGGGTITIASGATALVATTITPSAGGVLSAANQTIEVESTGAGTDNLSVAVIVTVQT